MTLVEPSEEKLVERDCGCAIYRGGWTVYCQRHDEYCGAAPASYYRSRYEDDPDALDYEEEEDYVDADDYDVLSEWGQASREGVEPVHDEEGRRPALIGPHSVGGQISLQDI